MIENTKKSIINDIISSRVKDFLLSGFRMVDFIKSEELGLVFNFDRDLLLIISEVVSESSKVEFLLIERSDSDKDFKTGIMVIRLCFFR